MKGSGFCTKEKLLGMKNRRASSQSNLLSKKSQIDFSKETNEGRAKLKQASNSFIKKSAKILQSYKAVFNKPNIYSYGDADTYFKQSLRNYDDYELTKTINWGLKQFRSHKSCEFLKTSNQLFFSTASGGGDSARKRHKSKRAKEPKSHPEGKKSRSLQLLNLSKAESVKEEDEEAEPDIFYSPNSQLDLQSEEAVATEVEVTEVAAPLDSKMADDEMREVENLVREAGEALSEVVAESLSLQEAIFAGTGEGEEGERALFAEEGEEAAEGATSVEETTEMTETIEVSEKETEEEDLTVAESGRQGGDVKSAIGYDPNIDAAVIKELEDAEQQAMETARIIYELKQRVAQLLGKAKMTEVEGRELEEKNRQLKEQMSLFEAKTKRIQFLVDQASLFENMVPPRPPLAQKHNEDMLPKVIICGMTENNMPKIIVCDDKKKEKKPHSARRQSSFGMPPPGVMPQFAKRLSESYYMQERLAAENADLEGKRYQLQEDLLDKDQTVDSLQRKLQSLQGELRMVCKENCALSDKLHKIESCPYPADQAGDAEQKSQPCPKHQKKMACGKSKGPCPADVESRLQEYSETTQQLEKQLCEMECEVRNMQKELVAVQQERQHLEQHRRLLNAPPCPPVPPCSAPPCAMPCGAPPCAKPPCQGPCNPNLKKGGASPDQQLRELREQYNRLQDDYKGKLTEVAGLRADTEKLKQNAKDTEEARKVAEEKVKEYEKEMKNYKSDKNKFMGSKEQLIEQEQQLNVAKQRFREAQDELEELRALIQDQQAQLDDYRNKYLQAQQQVEEQRRQIDMMEMENNRISEQVNLEIQRVKNQFQEKLQELTPLPDILKATQMKLQEAQQMHLLAERNNESLIHELQAYRDKAAAMANQMEKVRSDQQLGADEKATMAQAIEDAERRVAEATDENERLKTDLVRMEEIAEQNEKRVQEKLHEIAQLVSQLETVREESARQVARTKDRCETVRRSMQNQIADLERQLAQSRAQARSAQKDRDDIRQKMQSQINNLNENFEDAQMRIRNLQGHVNFLKSSYTSVFPNDQMVGDGMDACDCGNF